VEVIAMKWVTRENANVDRVACPWLIKRFIDKDAEFLFVPRDQVLEVAKKEDAHSYDADGAEFGHKGNKCTFDALVEVYELDDPALLMVAKIVNGADTSNPEAPPESAGLKAIAYGFALTVSDDHRKIELETPMYDGLYEWCKRRLSK
jgi:hypothetical protein